MLSVRSYIKSTTNKKEGKALCLPPLFLLVFCLMAESVAVKQVFNHELTVTVSRIAGYFSLRRSANSNGNKLTAGNITLDLHSRRVEVDGKELTLLKKEFDIKPKKTVIIRGKDLLDEFKRAEEAKKHEVKAPRH